MTDAAAAYTMSPGRSTPSTPMAASTLSRNMIIRATDYQSMKSHNAILRSHNVSIFKQRNALEEANERLQEKLDLAQNEVRALRQQSEQLKAETGMFKSWMWGWEEKERLWMRERDERDRQWSVEREMLLGQVRELSLQREVAMGLAAGLRDGGIGEEEI